MKKILFGLMMIISLGSHAQKSSEILPVLNVDALISPPNFVFIMPGTNYWQKTDFSHLTVPVAQVSGMNAFFDTRFALKTTSDLIEGVNKYYTDARARASISATGNINYNPASGIISEVKRRPEPGSGTTNASGQYTFTFVNTYAVPPNVQGNIINGTDTQIIKIGTPTTTSVTVTVRNRVDVVGLLPTWSNVNGANVDILATEK